jgi:hypothetical protein
MSRKTKTDGRTKSTKSGHDERMIPSELIIRLMTRRRARRRWWRDSRLGAALLGERGEILLAGFERVHFRPGRAFRIHGEPDRSDDDNAGLDILRDLGMILLGEPFGLLVVGLDLGADRGTVAGRIRIRVASHAGSEQDAGERCRNELPSAQATHRS